MKNDEKKKNHFLISEEYTKSWIFPLFRLFHFEQSVGFQISYANFVRNRATRCLIIYIPVFCPPLLFV